MSKEGKTAEVEDGLSSMRRLIAERPHAVAEPACSTDVSDGVSEPVQTPQTETKPDTDQPAGFVDTMSATIAEITQDAPAAEPAMANTESRIAHVSAFLKTETEKPTEKLEPYVLRPEMSADNKSVKIEPPLHAKEELDNADKSGPRSELNTAFQYIPDKEAEEITLPESEEDDEATLHEIPDADKPEARAENLIDEDALRKIVSEMVRTELQGDLGDRITRNVRKLVRREIHRTLASRNFE